MKLSVIIPVYNAEQYLNRCIDSIIGQTLKDIEIIIIDDGSTDNSWRIIEGYTREYESIIGIRQKNSGPAKARNLGIKKANGKYIGFVDSDDYIDKMMYETLYNMAEDKNIELAMCAYKDIEVWKNNEEYEVKADLEENKIYYREDILEKIISTFSKSENYGFYSMCNKIYLREYIKNNNFIIDETRDHGEDWAFNIDVFSKLESFIYTDKTLYNYIHTNKNSLMEKYRENQFDLYISGREKMLNSIPKKFIYFDELDRRLVYESSTQIIKTFKNIKDEKKRKEIVYKIIKNKYFKEVCKRNLNMGIKYKLVFFFINNNLERTTYNFYKLICYFKNY